MTDNFSNDLKEILSQKPPNSLPKVTIYGDFPSTTSVVTDTMMSLIILLGKLENEKSVIIPHVELKIGNDLSKERRDEIDEDEIETLFSKVLTLDNAAYLAVNLTNDLMLACEQLSEMVGGKVLPEKRSLEFTRYFMAKSALMSLKCASALSELLNKIPEEIPKPRKRVIKPSVKPKTV